MKVFGFAGWSGSGKTTLIESLLPRFTALGLKVSVLKHAHCEIEIDKPGKDSWRHRAAGAHEVLLVAKGRWVLMHEYHGESVPAMEQQLAVFGTCDLILVESYKHWPIPKMEVYRPALGKPLIQPDNPHVVAIATDAATQVGPDGVTQLDLNDVDGIAEFILRHVGLDQAGTALA